jgi:hypothetical protein
MKDYNSKSGAPDPQMAGNTPATGHKPPAPEPEESEEEEEEAPAPEGIVEQAVSQPVAAEEDADDFDPVPAFPPPAAAPPADPPDFEARVRCRCGAVPHASWGGLRRGRAKMLQYSLMYIAACSCFH